MPRRIQSNRRTAVIISTTQVATAPRFAERLGSALRDGGVEAATVCAALGFKPQYLSRWLRRKRLTITDAQLDAICAAVGKDRAYFTERGTP